MWEAGHDVVTGHSPYPFVYPPPAAFLMAPFGALPWSVAVVAFTLSAIAALFPRFAAAGGPRLALLRAGPRCASDVQLAHDGTLSRFPGARRRRCLAISRPPLGRAVAIVGVVATKIFLLAARFLALGDPPVSHRSNHGVWGSPRSLSCWGLVGFDGLRDYPHRLSRVAGLEQDKSYSDLPVLRLLDLSPAARFAGVLALTIAALGADRGSRAPPGWRQEELPRRARAGLLSLTDPLDALPRPARVPVAIYRPRFGGGLVRPPGLLVSAGSGKPRFDPEHRLMAGLTATCSRSQCGDRANDCTAPPEFSVGLARGPDLRPVAALQHWSWMGGMVEHVQPIVDRVGEAPARRGRLSLAAGHSSAPWSGPVARPCFSRRRALPDRPRRQSAARALPGQLADDCRRARGRPARTALPRHAGHLDQGREWVDQQWLAQLLFYGLYAFGGIKLALALHVLAAGGAFVLAVVVARWRGGRREASAGSQSPTYLLRPGGRGTHARKALALLLFVLLITLLIRDARSPSRAGALALPLLILWANIHGTALTGALLVALWGVTYAIERRKRPLREWAPRSAALVVAPLLCLFASPMAASLPSYYETMLFNSGFRSFVTEWSPTARPCRPRRSFSSLF